MAEPKMQIATPMLDNFVESSVKELLDLRPWMKDKKFYLYTKPAEIDALIDRLIQQNICSLDLETTSLNTRKDKDGNTIVKIVGICLAPNGNEGYYIPVSHEDAKDLNIPYKYAVQILKKLCANCVCIYHNFKYDGEVLRNHGIIIEDFNMMEDTYLMAAIENASRRNKGLKDLSELLLKRNMIEITELGIVGSKKKIVTFENVPPKMAVYYGGSDAMNTFALYEYFKESLNKQDPTGKEGPWFIYSIEKKCIFVTMEMERNMVRVNKKYLIEIKEDLTKRREELIGKIYSIAGREFDIDSPKQLGELLFNELKIKYPIQEKSATGQYITNEKVLEKLKEVAPIVDMILDYRGYGKILSTYIENFLNNTDENDEAKFNLNQVQADTGRYSSTGGKGLNIDGYCGVNCQNLPRYDKKDKKAVNLRKAIIARPGYKIATVDYSGEELRIGANFSKEPKWINEFLHGSADLHTLTAQILYNKKEVTKEERGTGKTINFLTFYGGGAMGFAQKAKIPLEMARKLMLNFFREYNVLNGWIKDEIKRCRKRGYSRTAFGRRRPLNMFYESTDKKVQADGDRRAVNSAVQGTGSDIIKIALYRVWDYLRKNGFLDDVKILMPIHDEIVFEIKEDKLDFFIPKLRELMVLDDITKKLNWVVPLEVDAEYGDTLYVDHDYFKELKEKDTATSVIETKQVTENLKPEIEEMKTEQKFENLDKISNIKITSITDGAVSTTTSNIVSITSGFIIQENKPDERDTVVDDKAVNDERLKNRIDSKGFYIKIININNPQGGIYLKNVINMLSLLDNKFVGPRCRVKFIALDGTVIKKLYEKVSVDALECLCIYHNI